MIKVAGHEICLVRNIMKLWCREYLVDAGTLGRVTVNDFIDFVGTDFRQ